MAGITGLTGLKTNKAPSCRMAYTLGLKQPVLCTLLGNDPFFFDIDPEALAEDIDDKLSLTDASFQVPEALKTARETSDGFITLGDDEWGLPLTDDLAALCRNALAPAAELNCAEAFALLLQSTTGQLLSEQADEHNLVVATSTTVDGVCLDAAKKTILINPGLTVETAALLIAREIRHFALLSVTDALKNPESAILVNRAMQAELATLPVQIAWELNLAGHADVWDCLGRSAQADLAYAFGHRASADFRALRDGRAAMAAFDQWFYSGRTRKADRALIQSLLASGEALPEPSASANRTVEALRAIGERGIGRNYLVEHMTTIMQDGFYADVRDRSNANFLWFVKFERSYRAAEAYIEEKTATPSADKPAGGAVILAFPDLMSKKAKTVKKAHAPRKAKHS